MVFGAFYLRNTAGSPEWVRWLHLARLGSQSQHPIWFILPARRASRIINRRSYTAKEHATQRKIYIFNPPSNFRFII